MEQMCSYCEKFFVVPPDEHGEMDVCPNCYQVAGTLGHTLRAGKLHTNPTRPHFFPARVVD